MTVAWLCAVVVAQLDTTPLHAFRVEEPRIRFDAMGSVRLVMAEAAPRPEFARRMSAPADKGHAFVVRWPIPPATDEPLPVHTASTFVIDWREPPVVALVEQVIHAHGKSPPVEALAAAVDEHVSNKNGTRIYDVASVVARRREGDCTEHAVLLVAVARAFGRPARVVNGLAVVEMGDGGVGAFGHAWAEVLVDRAWRPVDAALRKHPGKVAYVAMSVMENEGPGFKAAAMAAASPLDVRTVKALPK